jgi:hypothetical protein
MRIKALMSVAILAAITGCQQAQTTDNNTLTKR